MPPLRSPYEQLAGCCHLPRFADKIRLHLSGKLPGNYEVAFCSRWGVDGQFLKHFNLLKEEIIEAVRNSENSDVKLAHWFNQRIDADTELKESWNTLAVNLGKKGFPKAWVFVLAKRFLYKCKDPSINTAFDAIDWDEQEEVRN